MGYEAALLGKPVVVFSNVFYRSLAGVYGCDRPSSLTEDIKTILKNHRPEPRRAIEFLAGILANSYQGVRGHPAIDPNMMSHQNIDNWCRAFTNHLDL
jgi:hypothetical protein